ncbi:alpha/beta hydrolase [Inmirania thermothiophila]|uniref:Arylformamidase n=1 Tax=Inmirania thermothiophila TaxID=1750597 RepID=A0A3N1Y4L1_9GAMM|nr:alpha/beta hydrolase [Inmirania thermothiophila]ROR32542.1 arylformamidase [Inmirania thermothiophila]
MGGPVYRGYDRAALDAQYDARAAVPEHGAYFRRWEAASAAARARLRAERDLAYGACPRCELDYFPPARTGAPLLLFVHGGYWRSLDKDLFSFLAVPWVEAGAAVALPRYPLAPEAPLDEIVAAVREAALWLWEGAARLGFDRGRIVAAGHSAGAHLAAMLLLTPWQQHPGVPAELVRGALCLSGVYDLEPIRLSYLEADLRLAPEDVARPSPLHLAAGVPPRWLVLAVGGAESDEFRRQQSAFADAARAAGHRVQAVEVPGRHHFSIVETLADPASPVSALLRGLLFEAPETP